MATFESENQQYCLDDVTDNLTSAAIAAKLLDVAAVGEGEKSAGPVERSAPHSSRLPECIDFSNPFAGALAKMVSAEMRDGNIPPKPRESEPVLSSIISSLVNELTNNPNVPKVVPTPQHGNDNVCPVPETKPPISGEGDLSGEDLRRSLNAQFEQWEFWHKQEEEYSKERDKFKDLSAKPEQKVLTAKELGQVIKEQGLTEENLQHLRNALLNADDLQSGMRNFLVDLNKELKPFNLQLDVREFHQPFPPFTPKTQGGECLVYASIKGTGQTAGAKASQERPLCMFGWSTVCGPHLK